MTTQSTVLAQSHQLKGRKQTRFIDANLYSSYDSCLPYVGSMPTCTYCWVRTVVKKNNELVLGLTWTQSISNRRATSGAGTAYPYRAPWLSSGFWWGSRYSILSLVCMFYRSLFVLLHFFFWPLCYLFFFDIRIRITLLVSSSSCNIRQPKPLVIILNVR